MPGGFFVWTVFFGQCFEDALNASQRVHLLFILI